MYRYINLFIFFLRFLFIFMCVRCPWRPEEEAGVRSCEQELNSGPQEEPQALVTSEPSLWPLVHSLETSKPPVLIIVP